MSPGLVRRAARHAREQPHRPQVDVLLESRRIGISSPQSDTWSGTVGQPTAPRKIASWPAIRSSPFSGIIRPKRA